MGHMGLDLDVDKTEIGFKRINTSLLVPLRSCNPCAAALNPPILKSFENLRNTSRDLPV